MFALSDLSWHLAILVSFLGWGLLFARWIAKDEDTHLGLKVGWGVSVVVAIGGVLLAARLAYGGVLIALLGVGQLALIHDVVHRRRAYLERASSLVKLVRARPVMALMVALLAFIVLGRLFVAPYVVSATYRTDDDCIAYLFYPKQMVESGASIQPFSHRHATTLNGQSFLQALAVAVLPIQHLFGVDCGLFVAISVLVLSSVAGGRWLERSPLELLPEIGLALFPANGLYENDRHGAPLNSTSHFTGIALLLTVYVAVRRARDAPGWRSTLGVALPTIATFTLRPMYGPMLAVLLAAAYGLPLLRLRSDVPLRRRAQDLAELVGFSFALLVPWCIAEWESDRTPLFPLFQGWVAVLPHRVHKLYYDVDQLVMGVNNEIWNRTLLILGLAGLCIRERRYATLRVALVVGALVSWVVLVRTLPGNWNPHTARYLAPCFAAMAFAFAAEAMADVSAVVEGPVSFASFAPPVLAAIGLLLNLHESRDVIGQMATNGATALHEWRENKVALTLSERKEKYARMQSATAPGEGILVGTIDGYLFDFKRNPIYTVDHLGMQAPPPGFPSDQPVSVATEYLLEHGVRYLVVGAEKPDPIDLHRWGPRYLKGDSSDPTLWPQADWADFVVPGIKELDTLTGGCKRVYSDGEFVVVDLGAPLR